MRPPSPARVRCSACALPLRLAAPGAGAPTEGAVPAAAAETPRTPLHVLVADDHLTNRRVVELILASAGADLVSVENGAEAVAAFRADRFDVVLMDMQMPVMDGLTAIREIRRFEATARAMRTPILALTANALPEHVSASAQAGADGHIAKPIGPANLLAGVYAAVERARAAAELPLSA